MIKAAPTLYEWAGGEAAIRRLMDCFYDRVERDELLSPYFPGGVSEEHRAHVASWWSEVLGGPARYTEDQYQTSQRLRAAVRARRSSYERGRGKGSGVRLERRWAVVYTLRMGKVVMFQAFKTREEALEAAGVGGAQGDGSKLARRHPPSGGGRGE